MIVTRLWGGLGNQLFQYAFAYALAQRNGTQLCLDTRYYCSGTKNSPEHATTPRIFDLKISERSTAVPIIIDKHVEILKNKYINRIIRIPTKSIINIKGYKYIKESRFKYQSWLRDLDMTSAYLDGYWQCENYFVSYREALCEQFVPKKTSKSHDTLLEEITRNNSVAMHIRRGDYVNNKNIFSNLYLLESKYYINAIKKIYENIKDPSFYIFTNDTNWVRNNLNEWGINAIIVSEDCNLSDIEEFSLMSNCKHQVISNSTFSWWAAWLNNNDNKIIIAPERWFGNRDIIPDAWTKIPIE